MKAILFVGHGSKKRAGNEQVSQLIKSLKQKLSSYIVEESFLEFAKPTISAGIKACVERGATSIALVPMMFFSAGHAKIHIPHEIDEAKKLYPDVEFTYGKPIAIHEKLFSIFTDRLQEVGFNLEKADDKTAILLVGRGSSDMDANSDLYKIGRLLSEQLNMIHVEISFIGVTAPTVEDGVEKCIKLGAEKIYIVPYFLFTGILMDRMGDKLNRFCEMYPNHTFAITDYFGFHDDLQQIFLDRAIEAVEGNVALNCDLCEYRLHAMEHIDHHHHHDH